MNVMRLLFGIIVLMNSSCASNKSIDFNSFGTQDSTISSMESEVALSKRMDYYSVPGVSIAVVDNWQIKWAKAYGVANVETGKEADVETLFQAASISKPLSALAVLRLVEEGKVELDTDVNMYLKDWKVEENTFTRDEKVTLRRLLTHTAGITVHGFAGYKQTDNFPTVLSVLLGKGNSPVIRVDTVPGERWSYSGGGYTIVQKLIEDVSGLSFEDYMSQNILEKLGMNNSTYHQPLPDSYHVNASAAHKTNGKIVEGQWHNYPERAAAGLWTTPTDLAKYCIEIQNIIAGKQNVILKPETVKLMLTPHKNNWGLGPELSGKESIEKFGHDGSNYGFKSDMMAYTEEGRAVIIMVNGQSGWSLVKEIRSSILNHYKW